MRRVLGIRPLIPSECNELASSSHARWLFSARRARSIIVHFRLASFSIRALVSGTWAEQCVTSQRKSTHAARGTKITCIETHGPVTRFSFTSVEHRRFTWLCVTGGERSRSLSLRHLRAEKRGLGRSCSHERNSSRQVNLPRGSFDPPPSVHGGYEGRKSTLLPSLEELSRISICLSALRRAFSSRCTRQQGTCGYLEKCFLLNYCESFRYDKVSPRKSFDCWKIPCKY